MAALRAGDVDVIGAAMSPESAMELKSDPQFRVIEGLSTTDVIVAMHNGKPPFSDPRAGMAISLSILAGIPMGILAASQHGRPGAVERWCSPSSAPPHPIVLGHQG